VLCGKHSPAACLLACLLTGLLEGMSEVARDISVSGLVRRGCIKMASDPFLYRIQISGLGQTEMFG